MMGREFWAFLTAAWPILIVVGLCLVIIFGAERERRNGLAGCHSVSIIREIQRVSEQLNGLEKRVRDEGAATRREIRKRGDAA